MKNKLVRHNNGLIGKVKTEPCDGYVMVYWFSGRDGYLFAKKYIKAKTMPSLWSSIKDIEILSMFDILKIRAHQFFCFIYYSFWVLRVNAYKFKKK